MSSVKIGTIGPSPIVRASFTSPTVCNVILLGYRRDAATSSVLNFPPAHSD